MNSWTPGGLPVHTSRIAALFRQTERSRAVLLLFCIGLLCLATGCRERVAPIGHYAPYFELWVSPGGTLLAMYLVRPETDTNRLYLVDLNEGAFSAENVLPAGATVSHLAWLPNDKGIMFSGIGLGPRRLLGSKSLFGVLLMRDPHEPLEQLAVSRDVPYGDVAVSPSGDWAAVARNDVETVVASRRPSSIVQLLRIDGTSEVAQEWRTALGPPGLGQRWAGPPDRLFFPLRSEADRNRIAVVTPGGAGRPQTRTIPTHRPVSQVYPDPTGSLLAYQSPCPHNGGGVRQLILLDMVTGEERIVSQQTAIWHVAWSPNGTSLAFIEVPSEDLVAYDIDSRAKEVIVEKVGGLAGGTPWRTQGDIVHTRGTEVWASSPDGSRHTRLLSLSELP